MATENAIRRAWRSHVIEVVDDPSYTFGSVDNRTHYGRAQVLDDPKFQLTSQHAVIARLNETPAASVIFGATGGASGVHQRSLAIHEDLGFLAVGPFIVCFELPNLTTRWIREVDSATCFGIHICPDGVSLISHGELEISRLKLDGNILWQAGGRDIFTGELMLDDLGVHVEDFNGDSYLFDLQTGDA